MSDQWYRIVDASSPLTQGDIIRDCPVLVWASRAEGQPEAGGSSLLEQLKDAANAEASDVVVMTQACDLEQGNVSNVVLCSHYGLDDFKATWTEDRKASGKSANADAWRSFCKSVKNGYAWGLALLNQHQADVSLDVRIVNFQEIFTIPREFLESLIAERHEKRLQLLSPYREHLSQSFARFFMRVGLPTAVPDVWETAKK